MSTAAAPIQRSRRDLRGAVFYLLLLASLGLALLIGRALHAWGVSRSPEDFRYRVAGMALTLGSLLMAALYLLLAQASAALAFMAGRA